MVTDQNQGPIADPLYELLLPYLDEPSHSKLLSAKNPNISAYFNHLTSLSLSSLTTSEPQSLSETKNSLLLSLQTLAKGSHNSIVSSCSHLSHLSTELPIIAKSSALLRDTLPQLDEAAISFSETYNTRAKNVLLDRRRKALLLMRNVDRISSILELPTLLSSAIQSSNQLSTSTLSYASALDLNAHIRRLKSLYPQSAIIQSIEKQSEEAMHAMTTNLVLSLKTNSLKLAGAMRIISWLRRVSPELDVSGNKEGALGPLFLVCRLANLQQMLGALEPLRELADQEKMCLGKNLKNKNKLESSQQTESYLKRYIEIFREQSFAIITMYRSIFLPASNTEEKTTEDSMNRERALESSSLQPASGILAVFPLYLVNMLAETLREYLPNVTERSSRESLLTHVLYCASSLGRLGGDFSMILSFFSEQNSKNGEEGKEESEEWAEIIKKHRMLAGRLDSMVGSRET
ncbi:Conserved oligomeric Golgi complex subunit 8 [Golovinomyces cichoracearum]|uniref:Conserved oligomeric Golgi complex subunit 8 n=1 Tax=Golovinomyces cichoracearum TaxID=62708 RepID=A0A420J6C7_9PEZI|nr:Conserved oligomeric Golgi complex subunit 8 [Golovinomyces cichoracearum]